MKTCNVNVEIEMSFFMGSAHLMYDYEFITKPILVYF